MMRSLLLLSLFFARGVSFQVAPRVSLSRPLARSRFQRRLTSFDGVFLSARSESEVRAYDALEDPLAKKMFLVKILCARDEEMSLLREGLRDLWTEETKEAMENLDKDINQLHAHLVKTHSGGEIGAFEELFFDPVRCAGWRAISSLETFQYSLFMAFRELRIAFPDEAKGISTFKEIISLLLAKREQVERMQCEGEALMRECEELYKELRKRKEEIDLYAHYDYLVSLKR